MLGLNVVRVSVRVLVVQCNTWCCDIFAYTSLNIGITNKGSGQRAREESNSKEGQATVSISQYKK